MIVAVAGPATAPTSPRVDLKVLVATDPSAAVGMTTPTDAPTSAGQTAQPQTGRVGLADLALCDDHPIFVDALGWVLTRRGFTVKAVVNSIARIVDAIAAHRPDVCLLDCHFADGDGIDVIGSLISACPRTKVLVLTADRDPETRRRALEAGASGYLSKTSGVTSLIAAIARIMGGEIVADLPARPPPRHAHENAEVHRLAGYLTPREWECLELLVEGLGSQAIAHRLCLSPTTVRTHVQAVLTKLGVHSRLEAASVAVRHSLLDRPGA